MGVRLSGAVFLPGISQLPTYLVNDVSLEPGHHWHVCWLEQEQQHKAEAGDCKESGGEGLAQQLPHVVVTSHQGVTWHVLPPWGSVPDWRFQLRTESQRQTTGLGTGERERERERESTVGHSLAATTSRDNGNRWILNTNIFLIIAPLNRKSPAY